MADLITLNEYKTLTGIPLSDTQYDSTFTAMIPAASQMIKSWTERDFAAPLVTETRAFQYDGSGFLDIDDAAAVTSVAFTIPGYTEVPLDSLEWVAQPPRRDDAPVYTFLLLPGQHGGGISPEMGFTRNLDVLAREGRWRGLPTMVNVTAQWGWPVVPDDVKMATAWMITEWRSRIEGEGLASEAIESYSRSWSRGEQGQEVYAIPSRVRDVLMQYAKINV